VRWVCRGGKWGLTGVLPDSGALRVSYLSCIHRIADRTRFWRGLFSRMGDGGRVVVATQGCQAAYPIPPRLAGCVPDAPSVEALLNEMSACGFTSCCAKVHIVTREVPKSDWAKWLMGGCFSDLDCIAPTEVKSFVFSLPDTVKVHMVYYILVGIKLAHQNGLLALRPSDVHGLTACARTDLSENLILLVVPCRPASKNYGTKSREWHRRGRGVGLHVCSSSYRLLNHADHPNGLLTESGIIRTVRPVRAGEELTLDYGALPAKD